MEGHEDAAESAAEPYRVLLADPPWLFGDSLPGPKRGAAKHYACMSLDELARHPLPPMAADSVLFLWRVSAMPDEALFVMRAWGYTPKSELVWLKRTATGLRHFGMGRIVRAEHETCLIGTRGRPAVRSHSVRSTFEAPTGPHSQKPTAQYGLVEQLYAGPYVELFARRRTPGWSAYGLELGAEVPENDNAVEAAP